MKLDSLAFCRTFFKKSTEFLAAGHCASRWNEAAVTLSYVCPHRDVFLLEDNIRWVSTGHGNGNNRKKEHCSQWCVVCGGKFEWRAPSTNANGAKVFKAHAAPQGLCENLINALNLLANKQTHGDSPIQSIVTGLHERSRKNHIAVGRG